MAESNAEITLTLRPTARFEIINVTKLIKQQCSELLRSYRKAVYYSYHTTAGYLEQQFKFSLIKPAAGARGGRGTAS